MKNIEHSVPLAMIVNDALSEITSGRFTELNQGAVGALLHDFQRAWNERLDVYFQNEEIDFTTAIAGGQSKDLFKLTGCNSRKTIIECFELFIKRHHKKDRRVILKLHFDGKQIDAEWLPLNEYLEHSTKTMTSS